MSSGTETHETTEAVTSTDTEYLLVTEYFHPDTASTGQLMTDLATGLQERGLDVTVYTGQPNYHSGEYESQPRTTTYEGVAIKRIRAPQLKQTSLLRRLFNWTVFTTWMFVALLVSNPSRNRKVLFVSNPPMLPVALALLCHLRRWEYTYIVYDLYPDQPVELEYLKEDGIIARCWSRANGWAFCGAKDVIALGPAMKDRICEQAGSNFDETAVTIIHNWADPTFIQPRPKSENWFSREHGLVEPFTVLYSGNIGEFHHLESLVRAATQFDAETFQILIVGEGDKKESIVTLAEELGVCGTTVRFLPFQPRENIPYSLTAGDVSLVTVEEGFKGVCVSSKLYSALAAGKPVLGIVHPSSDEARVIDRFDAGIHVEQGDVEGLVEAIRAWKENPELVTEQAENARRAFETHFTKEQAIDRYYCLLASHTEVDHPNQLR